MRRICISILSILCFVSLNARQVDSCVLRSGHFEYPRKQLTWDGKPLTRDGVDFRSSFKATQIIAPATLMLAGTMVHNCAHDTWDVQVRDAVQGWRGDTPYAPWDDYLQYAPVVFDLFLSFTGVPSQHGFVDKVLEAAMAYAVCSALSWSGKLLINSIRPNGADYRSFPSGHSCLAFCGAELVRMEYGPWWGLGAYAVATSVAFGRIWHNNHWLSDVLMGAGVGILSAHVGGWLLEPFKSLCHIRTSYWGSGRHEPKLSVSPSFDPLSGAVCARLAVTF